MTTKIDIPQLLTEVDAFYDARVREGKPFTKLSATRDKIVQLRGWEQAAPFIDKNFDRVLTDLKIAYIPRQVSPGPMYIFPIRDVDGEYKYAQTKPIPGSIFYNETKKYYYIGTEPTGPRWLGNNPSMLKLILQRRCVIVVEGPYDFLACRLVSPDTPVLCPLSKTLGPKHIAYLRLLGIKELVFMYDNEGGGQGEKAARFQSNQVQQLPGINTRIVLITGGGDPSKALTSHRFAKQLKMQLDTCFVGH